MACIAKKPHPASRILYDYVASHDERVYILIYIEGIASSTEYLLGCLHCYLH